MCRITIIKVLGLRDPTSLCSKSVYCFLCRVFTLSYELNSVECGRKGHIIGYKGLPPKNKESKEEEEENSKAEEDVVVE